MKIVYICGKVTGDPNYAEKFAKAKAELQEKGYMVVNPIDFTMEHWAWEKCMRVVLKKLLECTAIHVLPDWEDSRGAKLEVQIATELGFEFI